MYNIPKDVIYILDTLNQNNFEAFIVGGCVRDMILGRTPKDFDITSNATPNQIKSCFLKTFDTGIQHGTVTVVLNKINYEITTYRIDGQYFDNRHPQSVTFTTSLEQDLLRRDFTMNAIAYHHKKGYIDIFFGINDIKNKIIKGVGEPNKRFLEDALRMLRAIRFSAQLGFDIEKDTYDAILQNNILIQNISIERTRDEIIKIIQSKYIQKLKLLYKTDILLYINKYLYLYLKKYGDIIIECLKIYDFDKTNKLVIFFQFFKNRIFLNKILIFLKFDNKTSKNLMLLVKYLDFELVCDNYEIKKVVNILGKNNFNRLLKLKKILYIHKSNYEGLYNLKKIKQIYLDILVKHECIFLHNLDINGVDLITIGFEKNKLLGHALSKLLDEVWKNNCLNNKKDLLEIAIKFKSQNN